MVPAAAAGTYRGRSVDSALRELAAAGEFQLVYTSELVPADRDGRRANRAAGPPLEVIAQVLAPLGLELRRVDGRTYAIVPQPGSAAVDNRPGRAVPTRATEPLDEVVVTASRYTLAADVRPTSAPF